MLSGFGGLVGVEFGGFLVRTSGRKDGKESLRQGSLKCETAGMWKEG